MRIIGCDLHSRQQTLAMLDVETGEWRNASSGMKGIEYVSFTGRCRIRCE